MKILVFGDVHTDIESILEVFDKSKESDLVIFIGDLTYFGEGMELVELIASFPKAVIMMHGNHEQKEHMKAVCEPYENIHFSDKEIISIDEFDIITYGGGGFNHIDEEFEIFMEKIKQNIRNPQKTIMAFHAPPHGTKLDIPFGNHHAGTISFREAIEEIQPLISFSGHIHECEGKYDKIGKTILHNPGPKGTLVDLNELYKHRQKEELDLFIEKNKKHNQKK